MRKVTILLYGHGNLYSVFKRSVNKTKTIMKQSIIELSRKLVEYKFPEVPAEQSCLYASYVLKFNIQLFLKKNAIIKAGSMSWPMIDMSHDDGVSPTHFSYIWTPGSILINDKLPEIHVWVECDNHIIDMNTKYLPNLCETMSGYKWAGKMPPDYLWAEKNNLPAYVIYKSYDDASKLANELLEIGDLDGI